MYQKCEAEDNVDLDTVINSIDVGIVFLDEHFSIRKYIPYETNNINLRAFGIKCLGCWWIIKFYFTTRSLLSKGYCGR